MVKGKKSTLDMLVEGSNAYIYIVVRGYGKLLIVYWIDGDVLFHNKIIT